MPTASQASASTIAGNTKYACYFYQELPKIGRNPADFGKDVAIQAGARIYEGASATTYIEIPTTSATITKPALKSYADAKSENPTAAPTGAYQSIASFVALVAFMFSMF